jgi:hypothetical protein
MGADCIFSNKNFFRWHEKENASGYDLSTDVISKRKVKRVNSCIHTSHLNVFQIVL